MKLKPLFLLGLAGLALSVPMGTPALAGSLQVDPIKVELTAQRKIAAVRVKNGADQPVTIRGYALSWSQRDGEDVHEEVSSVVVSPPVATIPPGGEQLVRVGLRSSATGAGSYRLIVEEVPEANPGSGVQVALRLSMPMFVMQQPGAMSDLSWSAWRREDGKLVVEAVNSGSGYVRLEAADAAAQTGLAFETKGSVGTVLPKSSRRWVMHRDPSILDRTRLDQILRSNRNAEMQSASKR